MLLNWFYTPTGMDAPIYLQCAANCAAGGPCWLDTRPVGYMIYASIPFRMGWRPEAIVSMHFTMMALSIILAAFAVNVLVPALKGRGFFFNLLKVGMIAAVHLAFMWGTAHSALSDVPAACAGLMALWLFILGCGREKPWLLVLSGVALGLALSFRVFYVYPAYYFVVAVAFAAWVLKRLSFSSLLGFAMAFGFFVFSQYALTFRHTGTWSLLDASRMGYYKYFELSTATYEGLGKGMAPAYGADAVQEHMHWYTCDDCMKPPGGWVEAFRSKDYAGILKLAWKRNGFYFGSYIKQPAIARVEDRHYSRWLWWANILAACTMLMFFFRAKERWIYGSALVFVVSVWLFSIVIHPESRYMMLVFTFMWSLIPFVWFSLMFPAKPVRELPLGVQDGQTYVG